MQKQDLFSCGRKTEGVCRQVDEYNPRPLCVWHNEGAYGAIQSEACSIETNPQVWVKVHKTEERMGATEVRSVLSEGTIEVGQGNKGFLIPLLDSQE